MPAVADATRAPQEERRSRRPVEMERPSPWAPHDWEIDRTHRRNAAATLRIHNSLHSVQRGVISLVCAIFGVSCTFFGQMLPEFTAKPIVKPEIHPESPFSP